MDLILFVVLLVASVASGIYCTVKYIRNKETVFLIAGLALTFIVIALIILYFLPEASGGEMIYGPPGVYSSPPSPLPAPSPLTNVSPTPIDSSIVYGPVANVSAVATPTPAAPSPMLFVVLLAASVASGIYCTVKYIRTKKIVFLIAGLALMFIVIALVFQWKLD
jgi:hypothetical protein